MEDTMQKDKLEQELGFLKESFDAEVINREEYEKGKERIEKKLKEIENLSKQDTKEEEKIKLNVIQEEEMEPSKLDIKPVPEPSEPSTDKTGNKEEKEEKKKSKFVNYAVIFVAFVILIYFSYFFLKGYASSAQEKSGVINKISKIDYAPKINVTVLNDRNNCFNCDTGRILNIIEDRFGAINVKEIDYNTDAGKEMAEKFELNLLPAYIFDDDIEKMENYNNLKQIFIKKGSKYILSEDAAGSSFYFRREDISNKLDFFTISGDNTSMKAETNLKKFLEVFREVKFDKHQSTDNLAKEIGIRNFPAFLVNNRIKFSGVYSAETIKDNFCKMNKLKECEKSLPKSLV